MFELKNKLTCPSMSEIEEAERNRKWFLAIGIISIILGFLALSVPKATTYVSVMFLGSLLLVSGIFQIFRHLRANTKKEFLLHFVVGAFYVAVGVIMILNPGISAVSLTLLIALFLVVAGILRIARAAAARFRSWGWVFFNGIVSLALGVIIWAGWPLAGLWVIGLSVGIEMVLYGLSMMMAALAERAEIRQLREYCEAAT